MSHEEFINKSIKIHGDQFEYLSSYINQNKKVLLKCKFCETSRWQIAKSHLKGFGCQKCSGKKIGEKLKYSVEEFENKCIQKYRGKYKYFQDYINSSSKIRIWCNIHNIEFSIEAKRHLHKQGCPACAKQKVRDDRKVSYTEFEVRANEIHNNKYKYFNDYKVGRKKIKIFCIKHQLEFNQLPYNHLNGAGCPKCCESKGENFIEKLLLNNNVRFEKQKSFEGCKYKKKLRFDFYLPEQNVCIEFDGYHHYNVRNNQTKELSVIKKRDRIKTKFCKSSGIKLVRIPYWKFQNIENILKKQKIIV